MKINSILFYVSTILCLIVGAWNYVQGNFAESAVWIILFGTSVIYKAVTENATISTTYKDCNFIETTPLAKKTDPVTNKQDNSKTRGSEIAETEKKNRQKK